MAPTVPTNRLAALTARARRAGAPSLDEADEDDGGAPLLEAMMALPARRSRLGLPAGALPVFRGAALLVALCIAGALGGHALGWPTPVLRFFDNGHWSFADIAAAWLAWIGVREARQRGELAECRARRWFALGFTSYAVGQMLWNLQVFLHWTPFPAPSDLFYMLLAPCCAAGMMGFLRGRVSETQRLAAVLDTLSLAIAVVAVALVAYLPERGAKSALMLGVMIAYPTMLFAASCIGLMMTALLRVDRGWTVWMLIAVLGAQGGLWMAWNALTLDGALEDGALVNSLFSVGTLAAGLAVSAWRVECTESPRVERFYEGALRLLPLGVVVGVTVAVAMQSRIAWLPASARLLCDGAAVIVILLAAARQTLLLRDRDQLLETQHALHERETELHALNQHLEQRVVERTQEIEQRNAELDATLHRLSAARDDLVRAQQRATVGTLAGGVADVLAEALGNAQLVAAALPAHVESVRAIQRAGLADPGLTPGAAERLPRVIRHVDALEESQRQLVATIDGARHMVGQLQQFVHDQESGRRRRFDALAVVREVVDLLRLAHRGAPVAIVVTGEPDLVVDGHPGTLGQVLAQLVDNAFRHAFPDGREGTIDVRVWPAGRDAVRLTVRDDGAGLAPLVLAQAFTPFFTTRPGEASGLGLAGARQAVTTVLGGRIDLVSPPEAGTTVTVTLPRVAPGPGSH